jgi:Ca2+-binding RTX toxin-like protein
MFVTQQLNELAKLALIASDTSYFTSTNSVPLGGALAPFRDTLIYDILPQYPITPGFVKSSIDSASRNDALGFKFTAYSNISTKEIIVAFGGTDGADPVDWTSNTELGWNQWEASRNLVFDYLRPLVDAGTKVHFTGHSLGGALAQYAAYEWIKKQSTVGDLDFNPDFDKTNVSLTTFNGLGGLKGLVDNLPSSGIQHAAYDSTVLQGLGLSGHFYVTNDLISRFGDGHVGGDTFLLDFKSDRTNGVGQQYTYGLFDAHRIETGFYANLRPGALLEFQVSPGTSPIAYLDVDSVQNVAALFGNLLNNKNLGLAESRFRLVGAVTAGLTIGSPGDVNRLTQAVITSLHDSGDLNESWFQTLSGVNWGAIFTPLRPVTGAISILSALGAVFTDAVEGAASGISTIFQAIGEYVGAGSRPDVTVTPPASPDVSSRQLQLQFETLMASIGGTPHLAELTASLPSGLDPEALAAEILTGGVDWLQNMLAFIRDHANSAGQTPTQLAETTIQLATALNHRIDALQDVAPEEKNQLVVQLNAFTHETVAGFANALPDFVQKIADVAFNLGQTISDFADIQLIDQAWAGELNDPRLAPSVKTAIEEAREIFQRAGQTVVIQSGVGANPFHTPGYVPGGPSSATLEERLGEIFRLSLPFAAGTGGQRILLHLQGPQANQLSIATDEGAQTVGPDGTVELIVPEGADQVRFTLIASDEVSADATVTLSATLVDEMGEATHETQVESVVSVTAFVGTGNDGYEQSVEDYSYLTLADYALIEGLLAIGAGGFLHQTLIGGQGPDAINYWQGFGDDTLYGNGGDDWISGGYGHDLLYGGDGDDQLLADPYDYHPDPVATPGPLLPPPTLDGKDYVDGGEGNDRIGGGGNDDRLIGGAGDDKIWGDALTRGTYIDNPDGSQTFVSLTGALHPGNDILEGGEGNDELHGDGGDDILDGGAGNDLLIGDTQPGEAVLTSMEAGDDFLSGGEGDDELQGNAGDDVLLGGAGDDLLFGDDDGVDPSLEGDDWLEGGDGADQLLGKGGNDTLIGGEGDDLGSGGEGDDEIVAGAGADQFDGEAGDDVLFGDAGNDLLLGGDGVDELDGGADDDRLIGGDGQDTLFGGDGADELQGGRGNDLVIGDAGNDLAFGEDGNDELFGGDGNDSLRGDDGDDALDGGAGDDILIGDADGQIGGTGGIDILIGGAGNDVLVGGGGQDTYLFNLGDGFDLIVEAAGEGNRLVFGAGINPNTVAVAVGPNDSLVIRTGSGEEAVQIQNFGTNNLTGLHPIDSFQFSDGTIRTYSQLAENGLGVSVGFGHPQAQGTAQGERIYGGSDSDVINAGAGNDIVFGGTGNDALFGGTENDTLYGQGDDDSLYGEDGDDVLVAAVGNDALFGGTGNDSLFGGSGLDYFEGGAGNDTIYAGAGDDWLFGDHNPNTLPPHSPLVIGGDDYLNGEEGNDDLRGGAGNDTLLGGSGNDRLIGGDGDDVLHGEDGDDTLHGDFGVDVLYGDAGNDSLYAGSRPTGGEGGGGGGGGGGFFAFFALTQPVDQLYGGDGDDYLNSGNEYSLTSDSLLVGGGGNDTFVLDSAGDTIIEDQDGGIDTVETFVSYTLPDHVENLNFAGLSGLVGTGNALDNVMRGLGQGTLDGRAGNDTLIDAQTYLFGRGDGHDTIVENDPSSAPYFSGGLQDTILMAADIAPADVGWQRNGNDLVLTVNGTTDQVTLESYFTIVFNQGDYRFSPNLYLPGTSNVNVSSLPYYVAPSQVEQVQFADGTVWGAGTFGATQLGSYESNVYAFGRGDGQAMIVDFDFTGEQPADVLQVKPGVLPDDVTVRRVGDDLVLGITGTPDQLTIESHFASVFVLPPFAAIGRTVSAYQLEQIQFADGTVWDAATIASLVPIMGTEQNDVLHGTNLDNVLVGLGGHDTLQGLSGNDRIEGGPGNDLLRGGTGHDTYLFKLGDGIDTIEDVAAVGERNQIQFGVGITQSDLTFTHDEAARTLTIHVGSSGTERLVLTTFDPTGANGSLVVGTLAFADGSTINLADLYPPNQAPTLVNPLADQIVSEDVLFSIEVPANTFADADVIHGDVLTYRAALADGTVLPVWLSFDPLTRIFSGTPVPGSAGTLQLTVTASDRGSLSVSDGFTLVISGPLPKILAGSEGDDLLIGARGDDILSGLAGNDLLQGGEGHDQLDGGNGADTMAGGTGNDTYVVENFFDAVTEASNEGTDTVQSSLPVYVLGANVENLTLTGIRPSAGIGNALNNTILGNGEANLLVGGNGNDVLQGGAGSDALDGGGGADTLRGGLGNDMVNGGSGNDIYLFGRGEGQDLVQDSGGSADRVAYDAGINPLDLIISRQANDLRLSIHGLTDYVTVQNWYISSSNRTETIQAGNGQTLLSTQVDQLIQAMASFSQQTGLTWDQAIDQQPQQVQAVLAASWQ